MKNTNKRRSKFIYPDLVFNGLILFYIIAGCLITLAIVRPFGLGDIADPLHSPPVVKPEWYFLSFFQFINYLPKGVGTGVVFIGIFLFCAWPFLPGVRGNGESGPSRRAVFRIIGIIFVFSYFLLTLIGHLAESDRVLFGARYHFDARGVPHKIGSTAEGDTLRVD